MGATVIYYHLHQVYMELFGHRLKSVEYVQNLIHSMEMLTFERCELKTD